MHFIDENDVRETMLALVCCVLAVFPWFVCSTDRMKLCSSDYITWVDEKRILETLVNTVCENCSPVIYEFSLSFHSHFRSDSRRKWKYTEREHALFFTGSEEQKEKRKSMCSLCVFPCFTQMKINYHLWWAFLFSAIRRGT